MGMSDNVLAQIVEKAGSVKALAQAVGVKPQAVSQWRQIPIDRAKKIADIFNVPLHVLRPDVWEKPNNTHGETP